LLHWRLRCSPLLPYTTLFRSLASLAAALASAEQIWRGSDEKGVRQLVEDNALIEKLDAAYADVRGRLAALERPLGELLESAEGRSEEHTSELQSRENLVCRLL